MAERNMMRATAIEIMHDAAYKAGAIIYGGDEMEAALIALGETGFFVIGPQITDAMWDAWTNEQNRGHTREEIFLAVLRAGDLTRPKETL